MWIVGGILLALGLSGLLPAPSLSTWNMPIWMSLTLIAGGGLIFIFSGAGNTQADAPVQPQPPQCSDARSDTASSKR